MGYWGFSTKQNRLAWALVLAAVLIGAAFWIPGVLQYRRCLNQYSRCMCRVSPTTGQVGCMDAHKPENQAAALRCSDTLGRCRRTPIAIWSIGWLFLVVFTWLPCFYFCCCARNPKLDGGNVAYQPDGLQMAAPVVHPAQHYTTQPFAAGPPYGGAPYGYASPASGYPAYTAAAPAPGHAMPGYPVDAQQQQQQYQQGGGMPVHRY